MQPTSPTQAMRSGPNNTTAESASDSSSQTRSSPGAKDEPSPPSPAEDRFTSFDASRSAYAMFGGGKADIHALTRRYKMLERRIAEAERRTQASDDIPEATARPLEPHLSGVTVLTGHAAKKRATQDAALANNSPASASNDYDWLNQGLLNEPLRRSLSDNRRQLESLLAKRDAVLQQIDAKRQENSLKLCGPFLEAVERSHKTRPEPTSPSSSKPPPRLEAHMLSSLQGEAEGPPPFPTRLKCLLGDDDKLAQLPLLDLVAAVGNPERLDALEARHLTHPVMQGFWSTPKRRFLVFKLWFMGRDLEAKHNSLVVLWQDKDQPLAWHTRNPVRFPSKSDNNNPTFLELRWTRALGPQEAFLEALGRLIHASDGREGRFFSSREALQAFIDAHGVDASLRVDTRELYVPRPVLRREGSTLKREGHRVHFAPEFKTEQVEIQNVPEQSDASAPAIPKPLSPPAPSAPVPVKTPEIPPVATPIATPAATLPNPGIKTLMSTAPVAARPLVSKPPASRTLTESPRLSSTPGGHPPAKSVQRPALSRRRTPPAPSPHALEHLQKNRLTSATPKMATSRATKAPEPQVTQALPSSARKKSLVMTKESSLKKSASGRALASSSVQPSPQRKTTAPAPQSLPKQSPPRLTPRRQIGFHPPPLGDFPANK